MHFYLICRLTAPCTRLSNTTPESESLNRCPHRVNICEHPNVSNDICDGTETDAISIRLGKAKEVPNSTDVGIRADLLDASYAALD